MFSDPKRSAVPPSPTRSMTRLCGDDSSQPPCARCPCVAAGPLEGGGSMCVDNVRCRLVRISAPQLSCPASLPNSAFFLSSGLVCFLPLASNAKSPVCSPALPRFVVADDRAEKRHGSRIRSRRARAPRGEGRGAEVAWTAARGRCPRRTRRRGKKHKFGNILKMGISAVSSCSSRHPRVCTIVSDSTAIWCFKKLALAAKKNAEKCRLLRNGPTNRCSPRQENEN